MRETGRTINEYNNSSQHFTVFSSHPVFGVSGILSSVCMCTRSAHPAACMSRLHV
jgi:hypothetical protein